MTWNRILLCTLVIFSAPLAAANEGFPFEERLLVELPIIVEVPRHGLPESPLGPPPSPAFPFHSPDGNSIRYIADDEGQFYLFEGSERKSEPHDAARELVLSADRKHHAFAYRDGEKWRVSGRKPGPPVDEVRELRVGSGKGRPHYLGRVDKSWSVVVGGRPGPAFEQIDRLAVSPNGRRYAYAALRAGEWFAVIDGKPSNPFENLKAGPLFSADSKNIAYLATTRKSRLAVVDVVIVNNKKEKEYPRISALAFPGPKKSVSYVVNRGEKRSAVYAKKAYGRYDWASAPVPVGKRGTPHFGALSDGKIQIVAEKTERASFDRVGASDPLAFTLNADATSCAYFAYATEENEVLVAARDGKAIGEKWNRVYPRFWFSPDGKSVVYIAGDRNQTYVVIDGRSSEGYDDVYPEMHFSADSQKVAFCARRGQKIWWKVVSLGGAAD